MHIFITIINIKPLVFVQFSRNVRYLSLVCVVLMLPSCQSAIRFSSAAKSAGGSSTAISSSQNFKSRANSSMSTPTHSATPLSVRQIRLLESAERWLGTPYRYGSTTRQGTDCSGFVMRIYEESGLAVPRSTKDQFLSGVPVEEQELSVGDLLFFNTNGVGVSHVGIYAGDDTVIHASSKNGVVRQSFSDTYLAKTYLGARRILLPKP
ncbi:MAG: C40 family peptidase [Candidatus Kapaibacteriota bacterium]